MCAGRGRSLILVDELMLRLSKSMLSYKFTNSSILNNE
jgi:hypothetical protein